MGLCPQGQKESDITEATEHTSIYNILKLENGIDEPIFRKGMEMQMLKMDL